MIKAPFSRLSAAPSKVTVYRLDAQGNKVFQRFETPNGDPCDENGRKIQIVRFRVKGVLI